ncbi:MAG: hypothetical protein ACKOTZ_09865 [Chloroflexota bacterium]
MTEAAGGFLAGIERRESFAGGVPAILRIPGDPGGRLPAPFDGADPRRLAGPDGSHPLAAIALAELVRGATDALSGEIVLTGPVRVGDAISGTLRIRAERAIDARSAGLRLVGVLLREEDRTAEQSDDPLARAAAGVAMVTGSLGSTARTGGGGTERDATTVTWVEVTGREISADTFPDVSLPASLAAGQTVEQTFSIPAPRLGPPSAHAGIAAIAWAVEARWEIAMGADQRVATIVDVRQHPDLLRAGVLRLPSGALNDATEDEGATLSVTPLPPLAAGSEVTLAIGWPDAPDGRSVRAELLAQVGAGAGMPRVIGTVALERAALAGGTVTFRLPEDAPPTLQTDGLTVGWSLRVTVDRKLRGDVHRERAIVVA